MAAPPSVSIRSDHARDHQRLAKELSCSSMQAVQTGPNGFASCQPTAPTPVSSPQKTHGPRFFSGR